MLLTTGSIIRVLGAPHDSSPRYFAEIPAQRRADAWVWNCGCNAEPSSPGRFVVSACSTHVDDVARRHSRMLTRY